MRNLKRETTVHPRPSGVRTSVVIAHYHSVAAAVCTKQTHLCCHWATSATHVACTRGLVVQD